MSIIQAISKNSLTSEDVFLGSAIPTRYLWAGIVSEKRTSIHWVHKLYEGSVIQAFWLVLTSSVK